MNWLFARMAARWRAFSSTENRLCWEKKSLALMRKRFAQSFPRWGQGSPERSPTFYIIRDVIRSFPLANRSARQYQVKMHSRPSLYLPVRGGCQKAFRASVHLLETENFSVLFAEHVQSNVIDSREVSGNRFNFGD